MNFPPSLGRLVLLREYWARIGIRVNLIGTEMLMMLGTPPGTKGAGSSPSRARLARI